MSSLLPKNLTTSGWLYSNLPGMCPFYDQRSPVDSQLVQGRGFFTKPAALAETGLSPEALKSAIARLSRKVDLVSPRRGFYLILRPEDRALGAPDPARWIDPLMKFLEVDYRISLLRAAAFHGAAHQAAMVFQVIAPRQLPGIEIGRQKIEFLFQSPEAFDEANCPEWLAQLKTDAGFAKVAGKLGGGWMTVSPSSSGETIELRRCLLVF